MTPRSPRRKRAALRLALSPIVLLVAGASSLSAIGEPALAETSNLDPSSTQQNSGPSSTTATTTTTSPTSTAGETSFPVGTVPAPTTIAANCSVDVTANLTAWIASVPNGSTLLMQAGGCYRIEGTVLVKDRVGLTIDGNGATFRAFTVGTGTASQIQTRNHFRFYGGRDLIVRNLNVRGVNTAHRYLSSYAGHHAFALVGVTNALIENTTVLEVYGDFVLVQQDLYRTWRWSDGVVVRNNSFSWSGRQGIAVTGGRNVTVSGNTIHGTGITVLDIEPDGLTRYDAQGFPTGGGAANVSFVENRISGPVGGIFMSAGGYAGRVDGVDVSRNTLDGVRFFAWVTGTSAVRRTGFTFVDNVSNAPTGGPRSAFEFLYVDKATVIDNTIPNYAPRTGPTKTAVKLAGSTQVRVVSNDFTGAATVLKADGDWYGRAWTGGASSQVLHCANRYWSPVSRIDAAC